MRYSKPILCALLVSTGIIASIGNADAVASRLVKTNEGYKVVYDYVDKPKPRWYVGANYLHTFAFFTENQKLDIPGFPGYAHEESHSGATQMGGDIFAGRKLDDDWWLELGIGYTGKYSAADQGFDFSTSAPFAELSINYNTKEERWGWLYAGLGAGVAFPTTTVTGIRFLNGGQSSSSVSPLLSLSLGYRVHVANNWIGQVGYKFSAYNGTDLHREWVCIDGTSATCTYGNIYDYTNDIGWLMNHSIQVGLAYEF